LKSFKVTLEDEELEAVDRYIKESPMDSLLSSYEEAVIFGILHQITEQKNSDDE